MPRLNTSPFPAKVKVPSVFGEGVNAEWAACVGAGGGCVRMMNARLAAHRQISHAFQRGTGVEAAYTVASDLVGLAAAGHTGLIAAVNSVFHTYCGHSAVRGLGRLSHTTQIWRSALALAIQESGRVLPARDECPARPRLTVVGR